MGFCGFNYKQKDIIMKKLTGICKYMWATLFFWFVQLQFLLAQEEEVPSGEYPLNPSPFRIVFYIVISFIVIAVVFKLLYRPKKKPNS